MLDIILIVVFIGVMVYGYKKGAISIIAKLVTAILAFVLAYFLAETVGDYISKTSFGIYIQTSITNTIENKLSDSENSNIIIKIQEIVGNSSENELSLKIVRYIFIGLGFMAVFIASRVILWIGQKLLESVFELPVLKTFNKFGGVVASLLLFVIELSIILAIIKAISTLHFMNVVVNIIDTSVITKFLYEHNIVTSLILTKLMK